ncbi:MAG: hypothetical protein QOE70_537 [Chthoniobacter sp.]|jgi:hypothetical protein|nr:hypothetical protein [Chthoniobacter sp.]
MILNAYTLLHVAISLVGILSGFVVLRGMLTAQHSDGWTKLFLVTTAATTVTGFFFPFHGFTPALGTGVVSLIVLTIAFHALYGRRLVGGWRKTYVITAIIALYLNVFVLIVQSFQKVPALKALAPKQTEPPFAITQLLVLGLFIVLGVLAVRRLRDSPAGAA